MRVCSIHMLCSPIPYVVFTHSYVVFTHVYVVFTPSYVVFVKEQQVSHISYMSDSSKQKRHVRTHDRIAYQTEDSKASLPPDPPSSNSKWRVDKHPHARAALRGTRRTPTLRCILFRRRRRLLLLLPASLLYSLYG